MPTSAHDRKSVPLRTNQRLHLAVSRNSLHIAGFREFPYSHDRYEQDLPPEPMITLTRYSICMSSHGSTNMGKELTLSAVSFEGTRQPVQMPLNTNANLNDHAIKSAHGIDSGAEYDTEVQVALDYRIGVSG